MLHVFAEGTRYTPTSKSCYCIIIYWVSCICINELPIATEHAASVEFAEKSGLPHLKHLLIPRTKGFVLCIEKVRGKFAAIYCATMVFDV